MNNGEFLAEQLPEFSEFAREHFNDVALHIADDLPVAAIWLDLMQQAKNNDLSVEARGGAICCAVILGYWLCWREKIQ